MRRESLTEFEKIIATIIETGFEDFLRNIKKEGLEIAQKMGIDFEQAISQETEDKFCEKVEKKIEEKITNDLRLFFTRIISEEDEPFLVINYFIESYERAIKRFNFSNEIRMVVPSDISLLMPRLGIFFNAYLEILEDVFKRLKFEYEVI